MIFVFIGW